MAEASISVAVRVRPFSASEAALLAPTDARPQFLGDGGLGGSPVRPPPPPQGAPALRTRFLRPIIDVVDDRLLIFDPPDNNPVSRIHNNAVNYMSHGPRRAKDVRYAFDRVFDDKCGQQDVFEGTTQPLLDGLLRGYNASVFAYGATGCGKTHTISGTMEDPGVIFLTMRALYTKIEESREESEVQVRLAYLEIYNETIRDLLSETPTPPGQGLQLREDQGNKISVVGITEHTPESPEHVLSMIQEGNQRRTMSPTEANAVSSRSHAVLQINVTQRPKMGDVADETTSASLNIIDLAGSERASATTNNGARMKEGANINKSLLALGNCINALCRAGIKRHIPYRNSKLTRLLKFSLGGNCKTVMIVCVSPSSGHYEETHNTLKYANQAKNIRTKITQNRINVDRHVAQYVQTIHELKEKVLQLEKERGPLLSEAEAKKRSFAQQKLKEVESELKKSLEDLRVRLRIGAKHAAATEAIQRRLSRCRGRADEVALKLREWGGRASPGEAEPAELASERTFLQALIGADEALLQEHMQEHQAIEIAFNIWANHVRLVTKKDDKIDDDTAARMKFLADSVIAQAEAVREKQKCQEFAAFFEGQVEQSLAWLTAASRSTVSLKDAAGDLEYKALHPDENATLSQDLRELASQLRGEADRNDGEIFQKVLGAKTSENATKKFVSRKFDTTGARRARASLSGSGSGRPAELAASKRRNSIVTRRQSIKSGAGPTLALPARARISNVQATPRKGAVRRQSLAAGARAPVAKVASAAPSKVRFAAEAKMNDGGVPPAPAVRQPRRSTTPPLPPQEEWEEMSDEARPAVARPKPRPKRDSLFAVNNSRVAKPSTINNRMLGSLAEGAPREEDEEGSDGELTLEDLQRPGEKKSAAAAPKRAGFAAPTAASQARAARFPDGPGNGVDENTSLPDDRAKFKPRESGIGPRMPQTRLNTRHAPYSRNRQASAERRISSGLSDTSSNGRHVSNERRTSLAGDASRLFGGPRRTSMAVRTDSANRGVAFPSAGPQAGTAAPGAGGRDAAGRIPSTSMFARLEMTNGLANGRNSPMPAAGANTSLPSTGTTRVLGPPGHTAARQRHNSNLSGRATPSGSCGTREGMGSNGPLNNQTRVSIPPR